MKWRKLFRAVHRDMGYVLAGLTLAYAISGLAVNHIEDWNPNYKFEQSTVELGVIPDGTLSDTEAFVVSALGLDPKQVRGHFQESEHQFRVFLPEGQEVVVDLRTGTTEVKLLSTRPVLYEVNALHLNNLKGWWTWVADAFAVALILLVITGLFMMKGKRGIAGRGKYFVGVGLLIPIAGIWYLYSG